jgi:hypothetical protein
VSFAALNLKGTKTVQGQSSTSDMKCVTLSVTVTTSGKLLMPFLIFKGWQNGCIAQHQFVTYPTAGKYACQPKAWMDEALMNEWIDIILTPSKSNCNANNPLLQPSILVLHAYHVHQMGLAINQIQAMGIEVIHIPTGYTYLCQPANIGIKKPIKKRLTKLWEDWMMDGAGIMNGIAKEPPCKQVTE